MEIYETLRDNYLMFGNRLIRVIIDSDEEPWFNFTDTAIALGIKKYEKVSMDPGVSLYILYRKDINSKVALGQPNAKYISEPGLYKMMGWSRKTLATRFTNWLHAKVAPAIRKFGKYQLKVGLETDVSALIKKINDLSEENTIVKNDIKKEKFPNGALIYIIEYPTKNGPAYCVRMTGNLATIELINKTRMFNKMKVVYAVKYNCPLKLKMCLRAMLYSHRYRNRKDCYLCPLRIIISAIKHCIKAIKSCDAEKDKVQNGGAVARPRLLYPYAIIMRRLRARVRYMHERIEALNNELCPPTDQT